MATDASPGLGIPVAAYGGKSSKWFNSGDENMGEFNQIEGDLMSRSAEKKYRKGYILSLLLTG